MSYLQILRASPPRTTSSLMLQYAQIKVCISRITSLPTELTRKLDNTLLLAFATTAKKLSIARIAIKWGSPTANPPDRPVNPALNTVTPTIIIRLLSDTNWMDGSASDASDPFHLSPSMAALSHLSILSPSPDGPGGRPTSPTVITIRSHLPNSMSQYNQDTHSLINRWELSEASPRVHPAFEQLSARRNSVGSKPGVSISHLYCRPTANIYYSLRQA